MAGKTTLAKHVSAEYWRRYKIRTLVLDITGDEWGPHSLRFDDEEKFWETVWKTRDCLIIVDEASETINRDKELTRVFTRMRHQGHKLLVIGHNGVSLLPIMREQIDTLYLFKQSRKACDVWAEVMIEDEIYTAQGLEQYEFLKIVRWQGKPRKCKLAL